MISCWLVDYCPQRFSFRYIFRSPMCYFHLCFFSLFVQMQCIKFQWWYLWCCFAVFVFLLPRDWPVDWPVNGTWYCWWSDAWFAWFVFRLPSIFYTLYTVIFSSIRIGWQLHQSIGWLIDQSVDIWLIGWSTDRSIDSFIDWLVVGWEAIVVRSFGLTYWFSFFQCLAPMNAVTFGSFCWPFVGL